MKKSILIFSLFFTLLMAEGAIGQVWAQTNPGETSDLGTSEPGVLPTNPFYFVKELGRNLKLFFTFDPVAKLQYESEVTNEKAAELRKVIELNPNNDKAIEKALANYNNNVTRLKTQLESLKSTSNNPNIQKLLDQLNERALRHQRLFEELKEKQTDLQDKLEAAKNRLLDEVVGTLKEKIGTTEKGGNKPAKEVVTPLSPAPKTREVMITDNGFSPSEIKIKKGDTVVWVNRSSAPSWPASAQHPTHTVYPGSGIQKCGTSEEKDIFDACRGLTAGESFKFTFNSVGSWGYHDHLKPSAFGRVIVE